MTPMQRIEVSPDMLAHVGPGTIDELDRPTPDSVTFRYDLGDDPPTFAYDPDGLHRGNAPLILSVSAAACRRIFGSLPMTSGCWYLPADLALLAIAIRDCPLPEPVRTALRLAKCIELLCATFANIHGAALVPAAGTGALTERDAACLAAARRLVDERWQEKLTLDGIARACGLNRAKLTRGFRQTFGSTVADAITDRRLQGAHSLLLATDLPVSSIGYRCGYSNNASFTRAFSRRFGMAPTRLRAMEAAA